MTDEIERLVVALAKIGRDNPSHPPLHAVEPFEYFFSSDGVLDRAHLDARDGSCTRRETLLRFLLLNAVIDQGPDPEGVRRLLVGVTNTLYRREVRFFHRPLAFFQEIGLAIDEILEQHKSIKALRSAIWAEENQTRPGRYNLYMDNSRQTLNYAVFRWGVPLALPLLLERDTNDDEGKATALLDYLELGESAEKMSRRLKSHRRYGLGKAIGDKACHLFAKWMVSSFRLTRRTDESAWGPFSFEVPYDSNAGRVLWRTGYLLHWASLEAYGKRRVVQPGQGKGGTDYLRVTNIRGMSTSEPLPKQVEETYREVAVKHMHTHRQAPRKVEIQRIQHAYLLCHHSEAGLSAADFDDGLIHVGTRHCFNHAEPNCAERPVRGLCRGYNGDRRLIENYRT